MPASRRSLLQLEILIQLDEKPTKTITELAQRTNSQRPSVSRSLQMLKEQGLVIRNHSGWCLTDTGRSEAQEAKAVVAEMAENVRGMMVRTNEVVSRLSKSFLASMPVFDTAPLLHSYARNIVALTASLRSPAVEAVSQMVASVDFAKQFGAAITPLLEAQERNRTLMNEILRSNVSTYLDEFTSKNNLLLAHITDNMFEMRRLSTSVSMPDVSQLLAQATRVNLALDGIWQQRTQEILSPISLSAEVLNYRVTVPTLAAAHYSDAVTAYISDEAGDDRQLPVGYSIEGEYGDPILDQLLAKLNPEFVSMRRGSWSALASGGYDRLRHASTSQRELVCQVLQMLVPDVQLPEDLAAGKPHVKARVKEALGGSKTNTAFVIAMAEAVLALYEQHNKYTHHNEKHEGMLRAVLRSGEGLLLFILSALDT